jgi:hypothetical protein
MGDLRALQLTVTLTKHGRLAKRSCHQTGRPRCHVLPSSKLELILNALIFTLAKASDGLSTTYNIGVTSALKHVRFMTRILFDDGAGWSGVFNLSNFE